MLGDTGEGLTGSLELGGSFGYDIKKTFVYSSFDEASVVERKDMHVDWGGEDMYAEWEEEDHKTFVTFPFSFFSGQWYQKLR